MQESKAEIDPEKIVNIDGEVEDRDKPRPKPKDKDKEKEKEKYNDDLQMIDEEVKEKEEEEEPKKEDTPVGEEDGRMSSEMRKRIEQQEIHQNTLKKKFGDQRPTEF